MAVDRQNYALQTIFSFFLGLMVVAFIGVGVNTFYQSPQEKYSQEQQELSREMESLNTKFGGTLTPADQAEQRRIQERMNDLNDRQQAEFKVWSRNTSIVLVLFATVVMGISLVRSDQLRVISNGLLLGGLFTMVYGTGLVIASGNSVARFIVILFALAVTLALGWLKFVRTRETVAAAVAEGGAAVMSDVAAAALADRIAALERRTSAAAEALGVRERES